MSEFTRRSLLVGASITGATAMTGHTGKQAAPGGQRPSAAAIPMMLEPEGWNADTAPELEFLFEARV